MAYTPTLWQDGVTPVNAANLNKLEQGLQAAVGIPADVVVTPGTAHLIRNRFTAGDTQPAFKLTAEGRLEWGVGGAVAADVKMYRGSGSGLVIEGNYVWTQAILDLEKASGAQIAQEVYLTGDATVRLRIMGSGLVEWANGALAPDAWLTRAGPHQLSTENLMLQNGTLDVNTQVAATNLILGTWLNTEAAYRFTIDGNGMMEWGPGGAVPPDTFLKREKAGTLLTDGGFWGRAFIGTEDLFYAETSEDPDTHMIFECYRAVWLGGDDFRIWGSGRMQWGNGTNPPDTNLYRAGAGVLATDSTLLLNRGAGAPAARANMAAGDTYGAWYLDRDGGMSWGPGGATGVDSRLYRAGAGVLQTDGEFVSIKNFTAHEGFFNWHAGTGNTLTSHKQGDSSPSFAIGFQGNHYWGPGGSGALDTNLYRSAAGSLKTDGVFQAVGQTYHHWTGAPNWSVLIGSPANGMTIGGDANLYRSGANALKTDGSLEAVGGYYSRNADWALIAHKAGDTNMRLGLYAGGSTIYFGPGNASEDTNLARYTPGVLAINGIPISKVQGGTLPNFTSAGSTVTFASPYASPPSVVIQPSNATDVNPSVQSVSTTGFTWVHNQGGTRSFYWIAVGN